MHKKQNIMWIKRKKQRDNIKKEKSVCEWNNITCYRNIKKKFMNNLEMEEMKNIKMQLR